ncbi:hypothetical protein, partial [Granulicella sp. L46]|uniref:hypothetical protein n=1 Tax=Granulicella sp. L46 TaxID=1641865 RepID=UPI001C203DFB
MEEKFFGFGHWSAPYWFIGPEQGKGPREVTGNALRAEAWKSLGGPETCDCFEFQRQIADLTFHTGKVPLQSTWKSLILLLLTLQGEAVDDSARKRYQRDRWGREEGETCIIELSGSASQKLREAEHRARHLS